MNTRKMTTEHLQEEIQSLRIHQQEQAAYGKEMSKASGDLLEECERELKLRWGIK